MISLVPLLLLTAAPAPISPITPISPIRPIAAAAKAPAAKPAPALAVSFDSPGFPASAVDVQGRLVEDWGAVGVKLTGEGVADGPTAVEAIKLDGLIPAARGTSSRGAVRLVTTAYRAPIHPSGADVLCVRVEEIKGRAAKVIVALDVPASVKVGLRTAKIGGRAVLSFPAETLQDQPLREWGSCDESSPLPGWGKPSVPCDPAFRNIRAGMGGLPIAYRFPVKPRSEAVVVLGFCESHWAEPGQRVMNCRVEGAEPQSLDPIAKWGRHKPGGLVFRARDENGDGKIELVVRGAPEAKDKNPILSAIWIFPPGETPKLDKVIAGALSSTALRYVDVGGDNDQSIYPPTKLEYPLSLPAGGAKELVFFVACKNGSAPIPDVNPWTAETLRRAAYEVWRDWPRR